MKKITLLYMLFTGALLMQAQHTKPVLKYINAITTETNYKQAGVVGIKITYKYNFLPLEELTHNDSILRDATFNIATKIYENNKALEPATGYQLSADLNGDIIYNLSLYSSDVKASVSDKQKSIFIPYAALKLSEGTHTITVIAELTGTDGTGAKHHQKVEKAATTFNKPATQTATFNIDYIEVNTLNAKGKAWDYSIFRTDAPDVGVILNLANTIVWKNHVNDTYMFAVGPKSQNIIFTISKGDIITLDVNDIDVMFHDYVANLTFSTKDKKPGQLYAYDTAKGNIKACKMTFKID